MSVDAREEDYEQAELFGNPALYTSCRVERMTVPKNLYCYDLRGSDYDPGYPVTVEPRVVVNHAGTVITAEPVDFNGADFRYLHGGLNILGWDANMMDFLDEVGLEYIPRLKYEPPAAAESEAALFFSSDRKEDAQLGCVGHLRFDFGDGERFWSTWWDQAEDLKTPDFQQDLQDVVDELRTSGPLKGLGEMQAFCRAHEDAQLAKQYREGAYGFTFESKNYSYYLRCSPRAADYSYLYCYEKEKLQAGMAQKDEAPAEGAQQMGGMSL